MEEPSHDMIPMDWRTGRKRHSEKLAKMETLPPLNTLISDNQDSVRNSYASSVGSNSTRNSYTFNSEISTSSSRTSISSLPDSLNRVSSFSRTSYEISPDSIQSSPVSSREPSPSSQTRWADAEPAEPAMRPDRTSSDNLMLESQPPSNSNPKDGPTALKELQDVRNIICVAFGAFDRYFLSWEDNSGEFHQESQKLPENLSRWLSSTDGPPRHLPTLQVSFGSNDDFFASDQFGKISSRDLSPLAEVKKPPPRLANIARGFMKRRAYTVSSPNLPPEAKAGSGKSAPGSKLERRNTIIEGQASPHMELRQSIKPISEHQIMRLDSKPDYLRAEERLLRMDPRPERPSSERRRSILVASPPIRPSWPDRRSILMARDRISADAEQQYSPPDNSLEQVRVVEAPPMRTSWPDRRVISLATRTPLKADQPSQSTPLIQRVREVEPAKEASSSANKYIDAEVQTEPDEKELYDQPIDMAMLTQASVSIGFMSEFFHGGYQFQLGDALRFV